MTEIWVRYDHAMYTEAFLEDRSQLTSCRAYGIKICPSGIEKIHDLVLCQLVTLIDDMTQQCCQFDTRCWLLANVQKAILADPDGPGFAFGSWPLQAVTALSAFCTDSAP